MIRCRCGHEFCYLCSERWRDYDCLISDEGQLCHRAKEIMNRLRYEAALPPSQSQRMQDAIRALREQYDYEHRRWWEEIKGDALYEECNLFCDGLHLEIQALPA